MTHFLLLRGKVGSRLKLVLIGTLAPLATNTGHWWFDLVKDGTKGRTHVQYFKGELETWDRWPTIRKANPLIGLDAHTRKVILEERDSARSDPRLKARFLSYRLNMGIIVNFSRGRISNPRDIRGIARLCTASPGSGPLARSPRSDRLGP